MFWTHPLLLVLHECHELADNSINNRQMKQENRKTLLIQGLVQLINRLMPSINREMPHENRKPSKLWGPILTTRVPQGVG